MEEKLRNKVEQQKRHIGKERPMCYRRIIMFDKLEDLVDRLDTLNNQLTDPDIVSDQNKFRKLMKEQSELTPIVEKYKDY